MRTLLLGLLLGLSLSSAISDRATADKLTIAVIPKGTTHEFWKSVHAGAVQASRELGIDIIWKGPLREDDRSGQINVVEDMVTRQVSGIVLAPLDETALRGPVENAVRGGSPVVIIDSALKSDKMVSFISTDNEKGGEMAGEELAHLLNNKGRVLLLRYAEGSASTEAREKGFLAAVKKHPGLTIASDNQYAGATTETAYKTSEDLLASVKNIDGIFCPNESTTFGMLRALEDTGLAGKVKFVGFDSSAKLIAAMNAGHIHALVVQNPMKMGYLGVKAMVDHLQGRPVSRRIDTGATVVTRKTLSDPRIHDLVLPNLSKWLD